MRRLYGFAVLVLLPWVSLARGDDAPKPIGPAEAAKKVGEQATLRMAVKSDALRSSVCFLNSEEDFKDKKNFTLFLGGEALKKFKSLGFTEMGRNKNGNIFVELKSNDPVRAVIAPDGAVTALSGDISRYDWKARQSK